MEEKIAEDKIEVTSAPAISQESPKDKKSKKVTAVVSEEPPQEQRNKKKQKKKTKVYYDYGSVKKI